MEETNMSSVSNGKTRSFDRRTFIKATSGLLAFATMNRRAMAATPMKVAYATGQDYYHHKAALVFKQAVEDATKGQIDVQLFKDAQLGGEVQVLEGLKAGTIEGYIGTTGAIANFVPEMGMLDMPYLFRDYNQAFSMTSGAVGSRLSAAAEAKGLHVVGYWPGGRRDIYGNVRIAVPDDLRGVKIRTLTSPVYIATFKALGALVTPLAWPETYGALQQGVIQAAETALTAAVAASQQEVVKFASLTGHGLTIASLTVASPWFNALPGSLKQAIAEAELPARARAVELDATSFDAAVATMKKAGITVITPDVSKFRQIVHQSVYPQFSDRFDAQLLKQITGA
jgi:tripartite ATP-independent transporter DctP family solute receptor